MIRTRKIIIRDKDTANAATLSGNILGGIIHAGVGFVKERFEQVNLP
jgi:outer membrane lipoprotein SlyB